MANETLYVSHKEIQEIRWKAGHRDERGVYYRGKRIIDFRESMNGDVYSGAIWRGVCVLEDGTWVELIEKPDRE